MALNIKNARAEKLAADLAKSLGTTKTEAIVRALEEKLARQKPARAAPPQRSRIEAIIERIAKRPILDARPADEIIGFDDRGLPR